MTHVRFPFAWPAAAAAALVFAGCEGAAPVPNEGRGPNEEHGDHVGHGDHEEHAGRHGESAHAHPERGPHGGELIELGEEEYHAELTHEVSKVTVYLLGPDAKAAAPIDAPEVTINLSHDGKPGLAVTIDGTPYVGKIGHDH